MFAHNRLKGRQKTVIPTIFIIILMSGIVFFLTKVVWAMYGRYEESVTRKERMEEEYTALTERVETMAASVKSLETVEGKEAVIRESYNVVKEGEEVVIILNKEKDAEIQIKTDPWYKRLFKSLFK